MICDPYPRLLVARDQVNQGAAALLMSVTAARRLGVPEEKWVYLHGHADMTEQRLLDRADLGAAPSRCWRCARRCAVAGIGIDDIATFDLYSCFPVPVFNICDGMGIAADDPRGLTLTGGLPYLRRRRQQLLDARHRRDGRRNARSKPGQFGLVGANGGIMSKYSVGVYSTTPGREWKPDRQRRSCSARSPAGRRCR